MATSEDPSAGEGVKSPSARLIGRAFRAAFLTLALLSVCLLLGLLWLALESAPVAFDAAAAARVTVSPLERIVPGPGLPAGLPVQRANNNVDLVRHGDDVFMAFRTAPFHFASDKAEVIVLRRGADGKWLTEKRIHLGRDLREPRLFSFKGRLLLYFFSGGTHPLRFEPDRIQVCERTGEGQWTDPRAVYEPGYVVWRVREREGTAYMSVYYGTNIYGKGDRGEVRLLVSEDGYAWRPLSDAPQVDRVGAEEGEFIFDDAGNLAAIVRLEVGGGALVCTAPRDNLAAWKCRFTPYKVDSSLLFRNGGDCYVIGRRNVAGPAARGAFLPETLRNAWSLAAYSLTRKRTTLYRLDLERLECRPLLDFPSRGDTAFAGAAPQEDGSLLVVNYSSPVDGPDWPWLAGQLLPTHLYEMRLAFAE